MHAEPQAWSGLLPPAGMLPCTLPRPNTGSHVQSFLQLLGLFTVHILTLKTRLCSTRRCTSKRACLMLVCIVACSYNESPWIFRHAQALMIDVKCWHVWRQCQNWTIQRSLSCLWCNVTLGQSQRTQAGSSYSLAWNSDIKTVRSLMVTHAMQICACCRWHT